MESFVNKNVKNLLNMVDLMDVNNIIVTHIMKVYILNHIQGINKTHDIHKHINPGHPDQYSACLDSTWALTHSSFDLCDHGVLIG